MTTTKNIQDITFLKEWNPQQFKDIQKAITRYFIRHSTRLHNGQWAMFSLLDLDKFENIDKVFGFAYTSSSDFAGYWICNVEAYYTQNDNYHYIGFAIGENSKFYAILWDKDENEINIEL